MKQWLTRTVLAAVLLGGGIWAWNFLHPGPEKVIKKRLAELARTVSVDSNEGQLRRLARAQSLADFFSPDVEVIVDVPGFHVQTIEGRDELMQAAVAARSRGTLKVKLVDVTVIVSPDALSAEAHFTGEASISGDKSLQAQEFRARLVKTNGAWWITRIETVKTLR